MKFLLSLLFPLFAAFAVATATTIDGTQLTDGTKPDRPFSETLTLAEKALGDDSAKYTCIRANARTPAVGGGWRFMFGSAERDTLTVNIHRDGKVTQNLAAPTGKSFPPTPRVSISDALSAATTLIRTQSPQFFFISAVWTGKDGAWSMWFQNPSADSALVIVDASGKPRLERITPQAKPNKTRHRNRH